MEIDFRPVVDLVLDAFTGGPLPSEFFRCESVRAAAVAEASLSELADDSAAEAFERAMSPETGKGLCHRQADGPVRHCPIIESEEIYE